MEQQTSRFSIDRDNADASIELADRRAHAYRNLQKSDDILDVCQHLLSSDVMCENAAWFQFNDPNSIQSAQDLLQISAPSEFSFSVVVLAYNRPASLARLLASLLQADYAGATVQLSVHIDGPREGERDDSLLANITESRRVAEEFLWPHGPRPKIRVRESNVGLAQQWYEAWDPVTDLELAFIFEDDTEVSPLFFKWATDAARKYYTRSVRLMHWDLLNSVRGDKAARATGSKGPGYLKKFAERFAGVPLMYGVCLQNQHLDPFHYPKKLVVRNANQPFMFSLIGSWGPLMYPLAWQAFREWCVSVFFPFSYILCFVTFLSWHVHDVRWTWSAENGEVPLTEGLVVDHFLEKNPKLWTPWIVRFAFETGLLQTKLNFVLAFHLLITSHGNSFI